MRCDGWNKLLEAYMHSICFREYDWGTCDCLTFVCGATQLLVDVDPMSFAIPGDPVTVRGHYKNREEAYALIAQHRGSMSGIMDTHFHRIKPNFAKKGDVVLAKINGNYSFGIVWQNGAYFKRDTAGFHIEPLSNCRKAWRV